MPRHTDESQFDYVRRRAQVHNRDGFLDDEVMPAINKLLDSLADLKRDRDEWKAQHENLLAMYQAQTRELSQLRAAHSAGDNNGNAP